jgi:hypothetical protein
MPWHRCHRPRLFLNQLHDLLEQHTQTDQALYAICIMSGCRCVQHVRALTKHAHVIGPTDLCMLETVWYVAQTDSVLMHRQTNQ